MEFHDLGSESIIPVPGHALLPDNESLLLDDIMSDHIRKVLTLTRGKVGGDGGAAERMGVNPATLRHKMRKLGIAFGRGIRF